MGEKAVRVAASARSSWVSSTCPPGQRRRSSSPRSHERARGRSSALGTEQWLRGRAARQQSGRDRCGDPRRAPVRVTRLRRARDPESGRAARTGARATSPQLQRRRSSGDSCATSPRLGLQPPRSPSGRAAAAMSASRRSVKPRWHRGSAAIADGSPRARLRQHAALQRRRLRRAYVAPATSPSPSTATSPRASTSCAAAPRPATPCAARSAPTATSATRSRSAAPSPTRSTSPRPGVGYDIACGNKAARTNMRADDIRARPARHHGRDLRRGSASGSGGNNDEPVDHAVLDHIQRRGLRAAAAAVRHGGQAARDGRRGQPLRRPVRGRGRVGVGRRALRVARVRAPDGVRLPRARAGAAVRRARPRRARWTARRCCFHVDSELGQSYVAAMSLAGEYAYAGRDVVVDKVLEILGAQAT